jgi:hypothetical protein
VLDGELVAWGEDGVTEVLLTNESASEQVHSSERFLTSGRGRSAARMALEDDPRSDCDDVRYLDVRGGKAEATSKPSTSAVHAFVPVQWRMSRLLGRRAGEQF